MPKANGGSCTVTRGEDILICSLCQKPTVDAAQLHVVEAYSYSVRPKPAVEVEHFQVVEVTSYIRYAESQRWMLHNYTCWRHPHIFCMPKANGGNCTLTHVGDILMYILCTKPTVEVTHLQVLETSAYIRYDVSQRWMMHTYRWWTYLHIFGMPKVNSWCCTFTRGGIILICSVCKTQLWILYTYTCLRHPHIFCTSKPTVDVAHLHVAVTSSYIMPEAKCECYTLTRGGGILIYSYVKSQRWVWHCYRWWRHTHIVFMPKANGGCCTLTSGGDIIIYSLSPKPTVDGAHLFMVEASSYNRYAESQG